MIFYRPERNFFINTINSAFINSVDDDFYFPGEMHEAWEMVYCLEGEIMASEDDRVYVLSAGQLVFHAPMEFHRLWMRRGKCAKYMVISFECNGELISCLGEGVFTLTNSLRHRLEECYEELNSAFDCTDIPITPSGASALEENAALFRYELFLTTVGIEADPSKKQLTSSTAANYKKILKVMNEGVDKNYSVDEIARECTISQSNLKKIFKQYAGCGVMEYYTKLRIRRACALLNSGYSVGEIGSVMSFSSSAYFSTVFKRETGVSPSKYVKK